jgi:hypothetical protein
MPTRGFYYPSNGLEGLFISDDENPVDAHLLFEVPHEEMESWDLVKKELSASECARLADCLRRSIRLKSFYLTTSHLEDPRVVGDALVNALHLRTLSLERYYDKNTLPGIADFVVGEDGNGILRRLLQNPSCELQELVLSQMDLNSRHFIALADMLTTSRIKKLDASWNVPSVDTIVEFAKRLPRMKCLKSLYLGPFFPELVEESCPEYYMPLVHAIQENYSIEYVEVDRNDAPELVNLLEYYTDLNRAGRRILATTQTVPTGLWPCILARAGTSKYCRFPHNSVFFFLQNCPDIFSNIIQSQELEG